MTRTAHEPDLAELIAHWHDVDTPYRRVRSLYLWRSLSSGTVLVGLARKRAGEGWPVPVTLIHGATEDEAGRIAEFAGLDRYLVS